jgi:hypothetical protein
MDGLTDKEQSNTEEEELISSSSSSKYIPELSSFFSP